MGPHGYSHLKRYIGEKRACPTNDFGKTGYPHVED
jgi:hypothetical protein